jgi:putative NIF3 family GTP cyclohydrolase 1 type 2
MTAQEVIDRMRARDGFWGGDPASTVTGIATTFTPTLEVLRRAVDKELNLIVCRESPSWNRNPQKLAGDRTFAVKRDYIAAHQLVVFRFRDQWHGQLQGLARALGWDEFRQDDAVFRLPETTLAALASAMQGKLGIRAARVIGAPGLRVSRVALHPGMILVPDLRKLLSGPPVDVVAAGEPVEWEASPYCQDLIASGRKMGFIALGHQASEEPGSGEMAAWLRTFISEVPVEWIPAGEPFRPLAPEGA